jgi:hypothetical protein
MDPRGSRPRLGAGPTIRGFEGDAGDTGDTRNTQLQLRVLVRTPTQSPGGDARANNETGTRTTAEASRNGVADARAV